MRQSSSFNGLISGLRALEQLARRSPLDLPGFAAAAELNMVRAEVLIETFSQAGYVRRIPYSRLYVLTPLGLSLFLDASPQGALASRAIERVFILDGNAGTGASVSLCRGSELLLCASSRPELPGGLAVGDRWRHSEERFTQIGVPIIANGATIGVVSLHPEHPEAWESRRAWLVLLADEAIWLGEGNPQPNRAFVPRRSRAAPRPASLH